MQVGQTDGTVEDEVAVSSQYQDKGLVIDAANMAAGATVYSSWYDNVGWVRNAIPAVSTDQQYDLVVTRRDSSLTTLGDATLSAAQAAFLSPGFRPHPFTPSNTQTLLGYSARFGIKNSSASANTYGRMRLQFMGL